MTTKYSLNEHNLSPIISYLGHLNFFFLTINFTANIFGHICFFYARLPEGELVGQMV